MAEERGSYIGITITNGIRWPPVACDDAPEGVRRFNVRDDDVFVVTYPKAGTHWTLEVIKNILCQGDLEIMPSQCSNIGIPMEYFDIYKEYNSFPTERRRVLMTHAPVNVLPKEIFEGKGKVVFIMRNPKDTAVSLWYFLRERRFLEEYDKWDSFLNAFMKSDMLYGNWFDFNLSYFEHKNAKNFLFLTYEEMKLDHMDSVIQLSDFISGSSLTDDQLERVVKNTTFNNMKKTFTGQLPHQDLLKQLPKQEAIGSHKQKFTVMRKGIVGDWKTHFTVSQNELFDNIYEDKMKGSSLTKRVIFEI